MTRTAALAGALELRNLPADIDAAYNTGNGMTSNERHRLHAQIREAQLEAGRVHDRTNLPPAGQP